MGLVTLLFGFLIYNIRRKRKRAELYKRYVVPIALALPVLAQLVWILCTSSLVPTVQFLIRFCILQAIKNWTVGRPGNEATAHTHKVMSMFKSHISLKLKHFKEIWHLNMDIFILNFQCSKHKFFLHNLVKCMSHKELFC